MTDKVSVAEYTLDRWSEMQRGALVNGNNERAIRGLPTWLHADFIRAHPNKFDKDVDFDKAGPVVEAEPAAAPARVDQRPA